MVLNQQWLTRMKWSLLDKEDGGDAFTGPAGRTSMKLLGRRRDLPDRQGGLGNERWMAELQVTRARCQVIIPAGHLHPRRGPGDVVSVERRTREARGDCDLPRRSPSWFSPVDEQGWCYDRQGASTIDAYVCGKRCEMCQGERKLDEFRKETSRSDPQQTRE